MSKRILCVPNVSEGRDAKVVEEIANAARDVAGVVFLALQSDADHNRSVLAFAGEPEAVSEAAFRCVEAAVRLIDLRRHEGVHPRVGAADVVPFVPLSGTSLEECAALARRLGERLARELALPVHLYGAASAEKKTLARIRRESPPFDLGPKEPHPSAGAACVGARFHLIAFNVELDTTDLGIARRIARGMRERDGGLPAVQALAFPLASQGCVQVSMNLVDYRQTSPFAAYAAVADLAREMGVGVLRSELVGLVPRAAVDRSFREATWCSNFSEDCVLEARLEKAAGALAAAAPYLDALAAPNAAPGGGSAAALAGAMGAALAGMTAGLTLGRKRYAAVEARMREIRDRAAAIRAELFGLVAHDAAAYAAYLAALKRPAGDPGRAAAVRTALEGAVASPRRTAELCAEVCELGAEAIEKGNRNAIPDGGGGVLFAEAACRLALDNVRTNLAGIDDAEFVASQRDAAGAILLRAERAAQNARAIVKGFTAGEQKTSAGGDATD